MEELPFQPDPRALRAKRREAQWRLAVMSSPNAILGEEKELALGTLEGGAEEGQEITKGSEPGVRGQAQ